MLASCTAVTPFSCEGIGTRPKCPGKPPTVACTTLVGSGATTSGLPRNGGPPPVAAGMPAPCGPWHCAQLLTYKVPAANRSSGTATGSLTVEVLAACDLRYSATAARSASVSHFRLLCTTSASDPRPPCA